jgi:hypothetical protein
LKEEISERERKREKNSLLEARNSAKSETIGMERIFIPSFKNMISLTKANIAREADNEVKTTEKTIPAGPAKNSIHSFGLFDVAFNRTSVPFNIQGSIDSKSLVIISKTEMRILLRSDPSIRA